ANGVKIVAGNQTFTGDYAILAVPYNVLGKLLPNVPESDALRADLAKFESSPITGIHLWFDREVTELPHAVLLDRTIQWMFQKSKLQPQRQGPEHEGSYVELVVSSSKSLVTMGRQEIVDLGLRELAEFFPVVRDAQLLKATVVK